jgi:hypothetical protein
MGHLSGKWDEVLSALAFSKNLREVPKGFSIITSVRPKPETTMFVRQTAWHV